MVLPVPVERTWAAGDITTAALLNSSLRDGVNFLTTVPQLVCSQQTPQSIANTPSPFAAIAFDTNTVDTYSGHSTVTNNSRYVSQLGGWYFVIGQVAFAANATGVRVAQLWANGVGGPAEVQGAAGPSANNTQIQVSGLVFLSAGSYVELRVYQASGGALNTVASFSTMTAWWMHT